MRMLLNFLLQMVLSLQISTSAPATIHNICLFVLCTFFLVVYFPLQKLLICSFFYSLFLRSDHRSIYLRHIQTKDMTDTMAVQRLDELVRTHDVCFALTDSREARYFVLEHNGPYTSSLHLSNLTCTIYSTLSYPYLFTLCRKL